MYMNWKFYKMITFRNFLIFQNLELIFIDYTFNNYYEFKKYNWTNLTCILGYSFFMCMPVLLRLRRKWKLSENEKRCCEFRKSFNFRICLLWFKNILSDLVKMMSLYCEILRIMTFSRIPEEFKAISDRVLRCLRLEGPQ